MSEEGGPCGAGPGVGGDGGPQSEKIEVALSEISKRAALVREAFLDGCAAAFDAISKRGGAHV